MKLSSNRDLYEYLLLLASQLENQGAEVLRKDVSAAARTANVFPAPEFLGKSRIALRRVLSEGNSFMSQIDRAELQDVLGQLDVAFDGRR